MNEAAIRSRHEPPWHYRISVSRHEPGVAFGGTARAGEIYVIGGSCRYEWATAMAELRAGEFAQVPAGDYRFAVLGASPCELVRVWLLPPDFRTPPPEEPG